MIDDLLFDMLYDNSFEMLYDYSFERIFWNYFHFPQKGIVLTVRLRLLTFRYQVSTISESNFLCFTFWNDIWLSFANEQDKIFVHKIILVRKNRDILLTKMHLLLLVSYTVFYARFGPYPCVEIKFLEKGDGLLCQILIILQC